MLILGILIGTTLPFLITGDGATTEPSWAPTGRLSQFQGFRTPRPRTEYDEAQMMFASVWAGWSAWSFCSNGVRIRVRACNTVRGFSCLGANQETRACEIDLPPSRPIVPSSDYDIVDPWESDRKEAMRQLYPDDTVTETRESSHVLAEGRPPAANIEGAAPGFRAHAAPTHEGGIGQNPLNQAKFAYEEKRLESEDFGAPGMNSEKMFGTKSLSIKPKKEQKNEDYKIEDITYKEKEPVKQVSDFRPPLQIPQFPSVFEHKVPVEESQPNQSTASPAPPAGLRPQPPQAPEVAKPIAAKQLKNAYVGRRRYRQPQWYFVGKKRLPPIKKTIIIKVNKKKSKKENEMKTKAKGVSRHLNEFFEIPDYEDLNPQNKLKQSGRSTWSAELIKREQGDMVDITDIRSLKVEQEEKQLGDAIIHALTNGEDVEKKKVDGREEAEEEKSNELPEGTFFGVNPTRVQPKKSKSIEVETDSIEEQLSSLMASADPSLAATKPRVTVAEEIPQVVTLPPQPPSVTVAPQENLQIRSESRREEKPEDRVTVVSEESGEHEVSVPPRTTSSELESKEIIVKSKTDDKAIGISRMEQLKQDAERAGLKVISPLPPKKKGFGIAGFTFKKAVLHQGEVTAHVGEVTTTTAMTTTQDETSLSEDTLNALDMILRNMTSAARIDDEKFSSALSALEQPPSTNGIDPIDLTSLLEADGPQLKTNTIEEEPFKIKKLRSKKKKLRKLKKAKKDAAPRVHDGEFSPTNPNSVKVFPKYRSRNVRRGHALALGVQTARVVGESNEKPMASTEEIGKSSEVSGDNKDSSQSADEIIEEINRLKAKMGNMDEEIEKMTADSKETRNSREVPTEVSTKLPRVVTPRRLGFIPGHGEGPMYEQPERIRIVSSREEFNTAAAWGEWSVWGSCFCDKQMRHRQCYFGNVSRGCEGSSFETRECKGGECPSTISRSTHVIKPQSLVVSNTVVDRTSLPRSSYRFARSIRYYCKLYLYLLNKK